MRREVSIVSCLGCLQLQDVQLAYWYPELGAPIRSQTHAHRNMLKRTMTRCILMAGVLSSNAGANDHVSFGDCYCKRHFKSAYAVKMHPEMSHVLCMVSAVRWTSSKFLLVRMDSSSRNRAEIYSISGLPAFVCGLVIWFFKFATYFMF